MNGRDAFLNLQVTNLRRKMGEFNRKKIEKFSTDIVNTAMREIYEEIG